MENNEEPSATGDVLLKGNILKTDNRDVDQPPSVADTLPTELVSRIFILFVSSDDIRTSLAQPLKLGSICARWRDIAFDIPQLWTSLPLDITLARLSPTSALFTQQWLARSGDLPLTLHITSPMRNLPLPSHFTGLRLLWDIINATCARWSSVNIAPHNHLLHCLLGDSHKHSESILDTLIIDSLGSCDLSGDPDEEHSKQQGDFVLTNARPTHISISKLHLRRIAIQWDNVTHAEIDNFYLDEVMGLLDQCHRLTHLKVTRILPRPDNSDLNRLNDRFPIHHPANPAPYPSLVALEFDSKCNEDFLNLGGLSLAYGFPSLEEVTYTVPPLNDLTAFGRFITASDPHLRHLKITERVRPIAPFEPASATFPSQLGVDTRHLLGMFPSLEVVELRYTSLSTDVLHLLANPAAPAAAPSGVFLPNIQMLSFKGARDFEWSAISPIFVRPDGSANQLRRDLKLCLLLQDGGNDAIPSVVVNRLNGLRNGGFDLSIANHVGHDMISPAYQSPGAMASGTWWEWDGEPRQSWSRQLAEYRRRERAQLGL